MKNKLNQKKITMSRLHKRLVLTILMILLLGNIGLIINEVMKDETTEETKVAASFSNTPEISYKVFLKENALFDGTVQPEETGYFSALIDHIEVIFNNKYQGVKGAEYKGDYTITGEIIGWEAGTEEPTPAWMKKFNISAKKPFRTKDGELKLSQNANINYNNFNAFVKQVGEVTGYNASCTMKVTMKVNYTITTAEGEVTGNMQPTLLIPLGESYFKITKSDTEEIKNDISKTIDVPVPVDYVKISLFLTLGLLCLIMMSIINSSVEPTLTDIHRKRINKLMKAHGNRIAAVETNLIGESLSLCYVHSMDDMIKISDEIERPIFYVFQNDINELKEFFIIEREKAYIYKVPEYHTPEKKKPDSNKNNVSAESGDSNAAVTT